MCTKNLSCPLCCQSIFPNIDALRLSLLKVTSRPVKCPICADELLGLDKLTIHLFGHSILGKDETSTADLDKKKMVTGALKNVRKTKKDCVPGSSGQQNMTRTNQRQPTQIKVKCDLCGAEFRDENLLKMHSCVSHGIGGNSDGMEPRFPCNMCSKTFKMKGSLKIHMRVVHLGCPRKNSSNTSCTSSSTTTTITTTAAIPVYHGSDVTQCNLAVRSTANPTTATPPPLHPILPQPLIMTQRSTPHSPLQSATSLTITTPNSSEPQIIKILDPRQLTEYVYVTNQQSQQQQQHQLQLSPQPPPLQQQHVVERIVANSTPPSVPSPLPATPSPSFSSSIGICGAGGGSSVPSPSQLSQPPTPQSMSNINSYSSDSSSKPWECDVCLKSFTTKYFLKKHKRLHTGEMPYSCHICGKAFTFQQSYHKHLLYHSDEKPHACTICGRAFKELSTLHNHERIHSGEKPFSCETCGKCFRQRVSYLVHRRIHTNTQPYKCTACDKSFRYKVSQRTHKCPAQPPGMVIRQTGDLLQKLLQSSAILPTLAEGSPLPVLTPPPAPPPSLETPDHQLQQQSDHDELHDIKSEDDINRTLDELLNESYDKMGISEHQTSYQGDHQHNHPYAQIGHHQHQTSATMEPGASGSGDTGLIVPRIENLCLLSPSPMGFDGEAMEVIDSIKLDLLYN
ncbi:zinc finger protein 628 [Armigeres subalbatus]|uniref:zinc finger protein 628 n=1 Tax=Armigeres subalbatus TaxID=124917 RepID=UPI002ED0DF0C